MISFATGAGVIHCDIRPKNVFMKQRLGASGANVGVGTQQAILADFDVSIFLILLFHICINVYAYVYLCVYL